MGRDIRLRFPSRRDYDAWARALRREARRDMGRALLRGLPFGDGYDDQDDADRGWILDGPLEDVLQGVELALFVGYLDQRKPADLRRLLDGQVYDRRACKRKYAVFLGTEAGRGGRLFVDSLREFSLVELAWYFTTDHGFPVRIEIERNDGRALRPRERLRLEQQVRNDIGFDVPRRNVRLAFEQTGGAIVADALWKGIDDDSPPLFWMRVLMAHHRRAGARAVPGIP